MFIVYAASTGNIVAVDLTETQARKLAEALATQGPHNVSVQAKGDREGGNVHASYGAE